MIYLGYVVALFVAFWFIGPLLAPLGIPLLVKISERRLRAAGIPVAADLENGPASIPWSDEQRNEVQRESVATGRDAVLWGRTIAASVASIVYIQLLLPTASWWLEFVPLALIWWMSKDRVQFPLVALALQFATRLLLHGGKS
jgi:hypothetical protein